MTTQKCQAGKYQKANSSFGKPSPLGRKLPRSLQDWQFIAKYHTSAINLEKYSNPEMHPLSKTKTSYNTAANTQ